MAKNDSPEKDEVTNDDSISMRMTCFGIKKRFPKVPQLSTGQLSDWLGEGKHVTLLDARPEQEFAISRISGAERVDPDNVDEGIARAEEVINGTPHDQPAVVYCSVGYRSSMIADKLLDKWKSDPEGKRLIYNLEGSLFKWANENRRIVDSNGASAHFVHPYNSFWGKLLESSRHPTHNKL